MLEEFLGIQKKAATPLTPQQMQMMQQMRNQNPKAAPPAKEPEIAVVANTRQNSVIIRAPADRVAVATEFLMRIDVPSNSVLSLADVESRVGVFRLVSLDPEKLIEIVGEMNVLEPTTRIRVDKDNNAIIVSGSGADRYIIESLIKRLDGSGRSFHVLQLRRLNASEVAESISFLMGQDDEKKDNSSNRRYSYYGFGVNQEEEKKKDEFRVAANARYRQVLLWANEIEMEQVESLLIKLGELPPPGGSNRTIRTIDASATPETYEYLQRLRERWSQMSTNPLEIPASDEFKDPNQDDEADNDNESETESGSVPADKASEQDAEGIEPADDTSTATEETLAAASVGEFAANGSQLTVVQSTAVDDDKTQKNEGETIQSAAEFDRLFRQRIREKVEEQKSGPPSSIQIKVDESGNLLLISPDTKALDQLENLMLQVAPPRRPYRVFKIKHASAFWMKLNLEEYFEEEEDSGDSNADAFYRWYWDMDDDEEEGPSGLGKTGKLKFVEDPDTNTLVVTGASSEQLKTIAELIELWDVAEPVSKKKARYTKLVNVRFGKADKIAETIKEAYRDLLSSNDKAFRGGGGQGGQQGNRQDKTSKSRNGDGAGLVDQENGREASGADFSFKGKLSLGVDTVGNTLLVSAEGEALLNLVIDMIGQLDEAAQPGGEVEVIQLSGGISSQSLETALRAFGAESDPKPDFSSRPRDRAPASNGGDNFRGNNNGARFNAPNE